MNSHFQDLFEKLDILWIPIVSEKFSEEICEMCDGLLVTGSCNDVHPKYYNENEIKENSILYDIYKKKSMDVNSYHKQSIKDIAPNFKITAVSNDGIIEAIEKENIFAVQWHPEVLYDMKIFEKFIDMCKNK